MNTSQQKYIDETIEKKIWEAKTILRDGKYLYAFYMIFYYDPKIEKMEYLRREAHAYMESVEKKQVLAAIIRSLVDRQIDLGCEVLAVALISDTWYAEIPEGQYKAGIQPSQLADRKEAISVMYATREGPEVTYHVYKRIGGKILFNAPKGFPDYTDQGGIFSKLFPPPRTAKNTIKLLLADMTVYCTKDMGYLTGISAGEDIHAIYLNSFETALWQKKNVEGYKILGFTLNDFNCESQQVNEDLVDFVLNLEKPVVQSYNELVLAVVIYLRGVKELYVNEPPAFMLHHTYNQLLRP